MSQDGEQSRVLPASRAFVLQLQADARVEDGHVAGRIEHVVSGQATHFQSLTELLAFMTETLRQDGTAKPDTC